ncbi:MAG TPA: hypothetical protein VK463_20735 [Desulfomonilaceae bacterium]|nr:hypothetical protein [Desulfomonilaceae bacterium]
MLRIRHKTDTMRDEIFSIERLRKHLDIPHPRQSGFAQSLPFSLNDATAGSETELQAAVSGDRRCVDLPLVIESSNYFANIVKRAAAGETCQRAITDLERYLTGTDEKFWENSWVRFPVARLSAFARQIFDSDMLMDRRNPDGRLRDDADKFMFHGAGNTFIRVPISYLIKLSLADVVGSQEGLPDLIRSTGTRLMDHFLSDNTSPETFSFHVEPLRPETGFGRAIAKETSKRYLITQLLIMYANANFALEETGQRALLYFSPHPPIRQKRLNECISDSFYRELFMSPCLSGWDDGQAKHHYMCLCHQVLSRSQLNAVAKLKDAGIIVRNLAVLPSTSNISLANNGTHISLGSARLTNALADEHSGFTAAHEKFVGDLVIKIVEHFLPLFVGTYSSAPYRLGFSDFHPEKVLSFLPHELDFTHLRMIWRRWKKKAHLQIFGQPITPFGIDSLDRALSVVCRVKGDFVPDFRLIDYLVTVMSTDQSPALDGKLGNEERLKRDLAELGVFDEKMSLYLLYRLREFSKMGFSGFEGRHYSLFESLGWDMANATDLQTLITALAFKLALQGTVTHGHVPDNPFVESERRQIFFASAIGLPTFFVLSSTQNLFMKKILERARGVRYSRRYPGYLRVYVRQYLLALLDFLLQEGSDLIEILNLRTSVEDLARRLERPHEYSVADRLTQGILDQVGAKSPMDLEAEEFNLAAERYYRTTLREHHIAEGLTFLRDDLRWLDSRLGPCGEDYRHAVAYVSEGQGACEVLERAWDDVIKEKAPRDTLKKIIDLTLISIHNDTAEASRKSGMGSTSTHEIYSASVCGEGNR